MNVFGKSHYYTNMCNNLKLTAVQCLSDKFAVVNRLCKQINSIGLPYEIDK
jgi:hypothetical protein